MGFLWFAALGAVTGCLTGVLMRDRAFGITGDSVIGVTGAMIGGYLFRSLALPGEMSVIVNSIVAVVAAAVLLASLRLYASNSTKRAQIPAPVRMSRRRL